MEIKSNHIAEEHTWQVVTTHSRFRAVPSKLAPFFAVSGAKPSHHPSKSLQVSMTCFVSRKTSCTLLRNSRITDRSQSQIRHSHTLEQHPSLHGFDPGRNRILGPSFQRNSCVPDTFPNIPKTRLRPGSEPRFWPTRELFFFRS